MGMKYLICIWWYGGHKWGRAREGDGETWNPMSEGLASLREAVQPTTCSTDVSSKRENGDISSESVQTGGGG